MNLIINDDHSRSEQFACGCFHHTRYKDGKPIHTYKRCGMHQRANDLMKEGMDLNGALDLSLAIEIKTRGC